MYKIKDAEDKASMAVRNEAILSFTVMLDHDYSPPPCIFGKIQANKTLGRKLFVSRSSCSCDITVHIQNSLLCFVPNVFVITESKSTIYLLVTP